MKGGPLTGAKTIRPSPMTTFQSGSRASSTNEPGARRTVSRTNSGSMRTRIPESSTRCPARRKRSSARASSKPTPWSRRMRIDAACTCSSASGDRMSCGLSVLRYPRMRAEAYQTRSAPVFRVEAVEVGPRLRVAGVRGERLLPRRARARAITGAGAQGAEVVPGLRIPGVAFDRPLRLAQGLVPVAATRRDERQVQVDARAGRVDRRRPRECPDGAVEIVLLQSRHAEVQVAGRRLRIHLQ